MEEKQKLYFRGIVNGELFDNVNSYNERLKQLIEQGSDIKCFTQTSSEPITFEDTLSTEDEPIPFEDTLSTEDASEQSYKVVSETPVYKEPVPVLDALDEIRNKFYGVDDLFATFELYINGYATDVIKYTKNNPIEEVRSYLEEYIRSIAFKKNDITERYLTELSSITKQLERNLNNEDGVTETIVFDEEYLKMDNYNKEIRFWIEYEEAIKAVKDWAMKTAFK